MEHFHVHVQPILLAAHVNQILACQIHVKMMAYAHLYLITLFLAPVQLDTSATHVSQILASRIHVLIVLNVFL